MKALSQSTRFVKDVRRMQKRGKEISKLERVVMQLAEGRALAPKHRDHPLGGNWEGARDCYIEPDWVLILIYTIDAQSLRLERTGTHSDLFE
jgi:mRNA interferase YafQ